MTASVVDMIGVRKNYGSVEAVRGIDLRIRSGELVAFLGPNGAGKTTSIHLMMGLLVPTAGEVWVFGRSPRHPQARRRCGIMLQDSGIPDQLSVIELVRLFRAYYPSPLPVEHVVDLAGLREFVHSRSTALSGGQRQRLYFALAICGDPDILFLDEPTVAMDVDGRHHFVASIREWAASAGKTIVLTTHYIEEADQLANRVIVIDRGRVIADDTPGALRSRVTSKHVTLRLGAPLTEDVFADLPVSHLRRDGDTIHFLSSDAPGTLQVLFARGTSIADLEVRGANLEEAFLMLTGGRVDD